MSNQYVMKYIPPFKESDLVNIKLKRINLKVKELCVIFDDGGIETLLFVIEDFQIATEALLIDGTNYEALQKYFKKILGHGSAGKLKN